MILSDMTRSRLTVAIAEAERAVMTPLPEDSSIAAVLAFNERDRVIGMLMGTLEGLLDGHREEMARRDRYAPPSEPSRQPFMWEYNGARYAPEDVS